MTPDQIEAENKKYGPRRFQVIPLSSGQFAITDAAYQIRYICSADEVVLFGQRAITELKRPERTQPQLIFPKLIVDLDL